jgi:cytochrome d ubiquinol oxidase subunit I
MPSHPFAFLIAATAPAPRDLGIARQQMELSLGWHIIVASLGIGLPAMILIAEWQHLRTGDAVYDRIARQWAKALAILFAVGAVSGTVLSFEFGVLWPGLIGNFGDVIGLPFAVEGVAFFLEAVFLGIYLYGRDRLSPRVHLLVGIPILVSGVVSAAFVVMANAWMNHPQGFVLVDGNIHHLADVDPLRAAFNPATPVEVTHLLLASFMVAGFAVAAVYATGLLRGRRDRYHRVAFAIAFTIAAVAAPLQIAAGDWAARFIAVRQPTKLAAAEGLYRTQAYAPLHLGGFPDGHGHLRFAIEIPDGLSLLAHGNPHAVVQGLDATAPADQPPVGVVHVAFDIMVGIGFGLLGLGAWWAVAMRRRRRGRDWAGSRAFLVSAVAAGPAAALAMEAGWTVTEVGRQPWIVYHVLLTADAVTTASGIQACYDAVLVVYVLLTIATIAGLRRIGRDRRPPPGSTVLSAMSYAPGPAGEAPSMPAASTGGQL